MDGSENVLSDRSRQVLVSVVRSYILNAEPVGSRFLTKAYSFNLSPATIRNIMADLEDLGYLVQPHTSAGRVPTDMGYRLYVDLLEESDHSLDSGFERALRKRFDAARNDINKLLEETTRTVSEHCHNLVFAVPFRPDGTTLNRIQLFRYKKKRTVAVILTDEGLITNTVIDDDFGLTQKDLNRISDYLNAEFCGRTINEMRALLREQLSSERRKCDILISKAMTICREALTFPGGDLIISGLPELLGLPEFSSRIEEIARAIENKQRIMRILDRLAGTDGVKVLIGSENPDENMKHISIVTAEYKQHGRPLGSVGIIGPTRLDYSMAIPLVESMANFISAAISE